MRLATFDDGRGARAGVVVFAEAAARDVASGGASAGRGSGDAGSKLSGSDVSSMTALAIADVTTHSDWPRALRDWLPRLPEQRVALLAAVAAAPRLPLADVELLPPIPDPSRFYAVGLNYADHAREMGVPLPKQPRLFVKLPGTVQRPYGPIVHPGHSDTLDYEGELAFVVGRRCRDVPAARAREFIAGYLVVDDLSLREFVNADTLVLAKGCDTFAPQGPWLTTADEVPDPRALRIRTWVDGELRQDGRTAELVYGPDELLAWCSRGITLEPGDVVTTGSPPGSGHGYAPPRYLHPGQRVRIEIDGLGAIENVVTTR